MRQTIVSSENMGRGGFRNGQSSIEDLMEEVGFDLHLRGQVSFWQLVVTYGSGSNEWTAKVSIQERAAGCIGGKPCSPWNAERSQWLCVEQNSIVCNCLFLGLNVSIFKETFYFITRMPVNENRTTKAKHIYYQMSPVDHCYRENISCRYSRGKVRESFFFSILWKSNSQSKNPCVWPHHL